MPDPDNPDTMLYDYGKINEAIVSNFFATGTGTYSLTKQENYLYMTVGNSGGGIISTLKAVDLNSVKKVHFVMAHSGNSSQPIYLGITQNTPNGWATYGHENTLNAVSTNITDFELDVSDYNGEYYIAIRGQSNTYVKLYQLYLEY